MKKLLLPLLGIIIMISCKKESFFDTTINETGLQDAKNKSSKIDVCHRTGKNWHTIYISINALPAHIAHGDIVPDADGDGFSKVNPCGVGSQDDCDDNNAAINPATTEICDNNKDDNCNGVIDENCIETVTICNQVWMLKNLDVANYRNGDPIPQAASAAEWTAATSTGTGAWCYYENNTTNGTAYGKLYNWYAVNDPRGLAPAGWHVPSNVEWHILIKCIDPSADTSINNYALKAPAGGAMKETGITHWNSPNTGATNTSGFTGLPGGNRNGIGSFLSVGNTGYWWTASESEYSTTSAWYRYLNYSDDNIYWGFANKGFGFSVRCLRD